MGREKRNLPKAVAGGPKERRKRIPKSQFDPKAPVPAGLVAKPTIPQGKSKHHAYFEFVDNDNKKKKLDFQITTKSTPPPGFEFVPIGNPALTKACKELSREKDAMIFIVSARSIALTSFALANTTSGEQATKEIDPNHLSHHVHRTGHHIREIIVEEARAQLEHLPATAISNGLPEPLPDTQEQYTEQVNSAILDLFPRIPNMDRQSIIQHAFNLSSINQHPKPVGLCSDMPLSRRVQLAVLAHIRHTHTRYDDLLREYNWQIARRAVEPLCLDKLVKWRGDEETGRDQLDEILREVVVISDSDSEESEDEDEDISDAPANDSGLVHPEEQTVSTHIQAYEAQNAPQVHVNGDQQYPRQNNGTGQVENPRVAAKKEQRGFKRYRAWEDAIRRNRDHEDELPASQPDRTVSHGDNPHYGASLHNPRSGGIAEPAGSVPEPNGFVPRHNQPDPLLAPYSRPVDFSAARPSFEQVTQNTRDHERKTTPASRHASPSMDRLQDMLVRSIEPVSPGSMQPSFVRTLPPRSHLSPVRRHAPYRMGSVSPSRDLSSRERPFYVERRVVSDRPMFDPPSQRQQVDGYSHQPPSRHFEPRGPLYQSPIPNNVSRPHETTSSAGPAQRITVGIGRPGENSSAILMEDRGGFYERVHQQPPTANHAHADVGMAPLYRPHESGGLRTEPHRIVSWEEGSRILRESRNDRDVEVIPASGHRILPPEAHPHMGQMGSHAGQHAYDPWPPRAPPGVSQPIYHHAQATEMPPLRHDYPPAPAQPLYYDQPPRDGHYPQTMQLDHHEGHRQYFPNAQQHPPPRRPPNGRDDVIVLD